MSINMNSAVREDLVLVERHFRRACEQVFILNKEAEQLTCRYNEDDATDKKTLRYYLRLRIGVIEGVRNMFYEFAAQKAIVITQLQRPILAIDVDENDVSTDANLLGRVHRMMMRMPV